MFAQRNQGYNMLYGDSQQIEAFENWSEFDSKSVCLVHRCL